ncbi:hypothetical protein ACFL6I_14455 [candidate division KSB1 bacterium]
MRSKGTVSTPGLSTATSSKKALEKYATEAGENIKQQAQPN